MNEIIMAYTRPFALVLVLGVAAYMEVNQYKVSEFFIGVATTVIVWFFKSRDEANKS